MAKPAKKKNKAKRGPEPPSEVSAGEAAFRAGDYPRARALLQAESENAELPVGAREHATDLIVATRVEPVSWWTFLSGVGFMLLVIAFAVFKQP